MTRKEAESLIEFANTMHGALLALMALIQDLAPVIGLEEAQRLIDIIEEWQKKGDKS